MSAIYRSKILLAAASLAVLVSCSSWTKEDAMGLFVQQMNMTVYTQKKNIYAFIRPESGVALEGVQEVQPGVMEYSLVDKLTLFVPAERKCQIIVVVEKDTGTMTSWRYNSKPEYCTANR